MIDVGPLPTGGSERSVEVVDSVGGIMDVKEVLEQARADLGAGKVFGAPVEREGVTVIPAAKIAGMGGAGSDNADDGGGGGGFGMNARPAGALIIEPGGKVRWKGVFDLNRVVLGGQIVGMVFFLSVWLTERSRARAAAKATIATAAIDRVGRRSS